MKKIVHITLLLLMACEIPTESYENPLDVEAAGDSGIEMPALVFFPDEITVTSGATFTVFVYGLMFENLAGSSIWIEFDKNRIQVSSVIKGDIFVDSQNEPIFLTELNNEDGFINITTSFLGSDSTAIDVTGSIAQLTFTTVATGASTLTYGSQCEMVNPDDESLEIKGFGEASIITN
jgi:hypothetical protein|tara:strand:- start:275 stop:808 length:534 start_codon:yes stop_codon:yes gene_type:complete